MQARQTPLAERMRPHTLEDFIGQGHLVAEGSLIRSMLDRGSISSMIFWGPPGVGKTTLARIIAQQTGMPFFSLSAIASGVKDVRAVLEQATENGKAILFIDEIHRFNKAQQDSLLGAVENGTIILIGATTENPSFEVIAPLLSRCQVYVLKSHDEEDLVRLLQKALQEDEWLVSKNVQLQETAALIRLSGGDARKVLNTLELVVQAFPPGEPVIITDEVVLKVVQQKIALYDKNGEQHYDIISAFIKSIRGSDPNAAVYWLARMIEGGEDPKFIARRLLILASEDIGNANPNALLLATSCFQAVTMTGYPECRIILSQTTTYLASSAKSNASYMAINQALEVVKQTGDLPVPLHLRNAPTKLMKQMNYGKNYQYAHSFENNFVNQEFMPEMLSGVKLYDPGQNAHESKLREQLKALWNEKYNY